MTDLHIYSALTLSAPFETLAALWRETEPNHPLAIRWHPSGIIEQKIVAGEGGDLVIATVETLDRLITKELVRPSSRIEVVDSPIGIAVKAGAKKPDISDRHRLKESLLDARSVAWSEAGASGVWFADLLHRLDIERAMRARGTVIPSGFTAEQLINGNADLAIQQISELLMVKGIEIVGPFPPPLQQPISLSAAVLHSARQPAAAATFLNWLKTPEVTAVFSQFGLVRRD